MNKGLKLGIEIGLGVVIVLLAYLSYHSVMVDLKFGEEKARRQALVIEKLLDARELQYAYEAKYSKYADTWDELIRFAKEDSLEFTKTIGDIEDSVDVTHGGVLPQMTSCCPGWVKFVEYYYPELIPNLSTRRPHPSGNRPRTRCPGRCSAQ